MNTCRAQYSIQREINNIASSQPDWAKKIRNLAWREAVRQKLLAKTDQWCDYKTNTCHCDPTYRPNAAPHQPLASRIGKKV